VTGAANLDGLLGDRELDAFVLFSSIAGVWGSGGQAPYAAANAYLDALAEQRRARGRTATSIAWGPWAEAGMAAEDGSTEHLRRRGVTALPPAQAIAAMAAALGDTALAAVTVADIQWDRFAPAFTSLRPSALLGGLPEVRSVETAGGAEDVTAALRDRLAGADRDAGLLELVRTAVASVLGYASIEEVESEREFRELGVDSLTAVELRDALTAATGLRLPAGMVFDHPTPLVLAAYLRAGLWPDDTGDLDPEEQKVRRYLAGVSIAELRSAGLMDLILRAADAHAGEAAGADGEQQPDVQAMDADELVRLVLGGTDS
jgi:acyl carrier protein